MSWVGGTKVWRPWINPATGVQGQHGGYGVWFQFNKAGLARQKVKGTRPTGGDSTGLVLGDQAEHAALGIGAWPGSRTWPGAMGTAAAARGAAIAAGTGAAPAATSSWGHQVAMQWGGPAAQWNASSATNAAVAGANAQELYQTAVEDAVTYVVAHTPGAALNQFRIKHTAYNYPGTHVAKYMRIKIYHQAGAGPIRQVVDQVTPDFAPFLAGGRGQAGTARRAFQLQIENQLTGAAAHARAPTRGTDPTVVRSWAAAATPARGGACFLTTACIEFKGLPDHCVELTELRAFRDGPMQRMREGRRLIRDYYRMAPDIVAAIERQPNRAEILGDLYRDLVVESIFLVRAGRHRDAVAQYRHEVLLLRDRLLPRQSARRPRKSTRRKRS